MVSEKQLIANKENAKLGGVKSSEGKEITRYNALKHCIFRETITEYEQNDFSDIAEQLFLDLKPVGAVEELLFERVVISYVKLFRLAKAESEYIKATLHPNETHLIINPPDDAYFPRIDSQDMNPLANIYGRYETTIENRMYKALHELERLQRMRKGETLPPPVAVDVGS